MNLEDAYFMFRDLYEKCQDYNIDAFNVPVIYWDDATNHFKNVHLIYDLQNECGDEDTYFVEVKIK